MQTRSQTNNKRIIAKTQDTKTVSRPVTRSQTKQRQQERAGWDYEPLLVRMMTRQMSKATDKPKATEQLPLPVAKPKATEKLRRSPRLNKVENIQLTITEKTYDDDDSDYYPESDCESDIDFEEASRAWRQNKTHIGNGMFKYNTRSRSRA